MPGNYQMSPDRLVEELRAVADLGLGGVILFGIPAEKDAAGSDAVSESGIIAQAVRAAKAAVPDLLVITDVCFCEYTDHGHCGPTSEATGRLTSITTPPCSFWPGKRWCTRGPGPTWWPPAG